MEKSITYSFLIRLLISAIISAVFLTITSWTSYSWKNIYSLFFVGIYLFWESHYAVLMYCYRKVFTQKVFTQVIILSSSSLGCLLFFNLFMYQSYSFEQYKKVLFFVGIVMAGITIVHLLLLTIRQLSFQLYKELKEKRLVLEEKYKSIKSKSILHFLQNSLQATQKLIALDPENAHLQIETLTDLLRSLLQSRDKDYISLKEESDLVQEFVKLLELQGNVKIVFSIENDPKYHDFLIPPFVLILIFDNIFLNRSFIPYAELQVYVENGIYLVAKYKQLRKASFAEKQEELLKNLKQRYYFTEQDNNIAMISTQSHNFVKVPLLNPQNVDKRL